MINDWEDETQYTRDGVSTAAEGLHTQAAPTTVKCVDTHFLLYIYYVKITFC